MLTDAEKKIVYAGWAQATKDKMALGMDIFLTMFTMYPKHKELFNDFRGKSVEELKNLPQMKAHALRVVNTLDGAIQNLNDMAVCASSLEFIGRSHHGRGVAVSHFEDLNKVIATVMEKRLGKAFTDNKAVWVKLLQGIVPVIQRGL